MSTRLSRTSLGPRAKTIPAKRITRAMLAEGRRLYPPVDVERPQTRGDCAGVARPCPFVACKHSMYLDVNPETGSIKLNRPDLEPWEMPADASCSLDVAERGGITLEEIGVVTNLTRERIRQVEVRGLLNLRQNAMERCISGEDLAAFAKPADHVEDDMSGVGGTTELLVGYRPGGSTTDVEQSPRFITARPGPRKFGKREKSRRMFTCDVEHTLGIVLVPRRGCYLTAIDKEGNVTRDREHLPSKQLYVNRGDRLMVWGNPANDEIALVEVITITPTDKGERLRVHRIAGEITRATTVAFVVAARRAA